MSEAFAWASAHSAEILTGIGMLVGLASLITGLTPTPKDDAVVAKIKSFLHRLGVLRHTDEPGTIKLPLQGPKK